MYGAFGNNSVFNRTVNETDTALSARLCCVGVFLLVFTFVFQLNDKSHFGNIEVNIGDVSGAIWKYKR